MADDTVWDEEAKNYLANSPEMDGLEVILDAADQLRHAMVPESTYEMDYLAGRIAISIEEAQLALGIGQRTMRTALRDGTIPSVKVGGRRLIPVKALERHLEALAYAESGALDAWQQALVRGTSARLKEANRRAWERRKFLRRRLKQSRAAIAEGRSQLHREEVIALKGDLAELRNQQAITEKFASDFTVELEGLERELEQD
ncbi:MAG TPA: helix-turn-helix domain-containing protein [Verrucomicrobiae bacterium]|nr:helix-turn-helix domain-containing protein [Verrucomicrobiae bacterium]